jgi:D-alanine-D-alanine ligase
MRVGLIFGGRSVEHRVSLVSSRTVAAGLAEAGHEVVPLGIAEDGCWVGRAASASAVAGKLDVLAAVGEPVAATLSHLFAADVDALFPIVHGTWGEDGTLQGLCEMLDLPYVGAGVAACAIAMDKRLCKQVHQAAGVPVVEFVSFGRAAVEADAVACAAACDHLPLPVFVKPSVGGSSVGVRRVDAREELAAALLAALAFDDTVLVERGVTGRELECAVLGYPDLAASAIGEIVPGNEFYDYEDKYLLDRARLIAPAELTPEQAAEMQRLATAAFAAVGGCGMARVDFFLESATGRIYVNEINTHPGFTKISMYPRLWALSGVPLAALVGRLVDQAQARHRDRTRLDRGIKGFLAGLS